MRLGRPGTRRRDLAAGAMNEEGEVPQHSAVGNYGGNPVLIDSHRCRHRYKFGGLVTMPAPDDCETIEEFYRRQYG